MPHGVSRGVLCLTVSAVLAVAACAHRAPPPVLTPPAVSARRDEIPPLPISALTIPLALPITLLRELLQQRLSLPGAPDWQQITAPGESPEVGIRYEAELGTPQIEVAGAVVHTTLPIHYFGAFRARAHTPFGWLWLAKNVEWGTRARRGTIEIRIATELSVSPTWKLQARSTLSGVTLTPPAVDKLCAGKLVKVCVPAELVRERLHAELDRQVREKVSAGLAGMDAQIDSGNYLAGFVQQLWDRLQTPTAQPGEEALLLDPQGLALGPLTVRADRLASEIRVAAYPRWSKQKEAHRSSLPEATEPGAAAEEVYFDSLLSLSSISEGMSRGLAGEVADHGGYRVRRVELLGPSERAERWVVAITLEDEHSSIVAYGDALLVLEKQSAQLGDLRLSAQSNALLSQVGVTSNDLMELLSRAARLELGNMLEERMSAVHTALARSVSPWPVDFPPSHTTLVAAYAGESGVVFRARAR